MENKADNGFWRLDSAQKVFVSEAEERRGGVSSIMCKEGGREKMTTDETAKPI